MASHIQVSIDSPSHFTARQPPTSVPILIVIVPVLLLLFFAYRSFRRRERIAAGCLLLAVAGVVLLAAPSSTSYRVEGDAASSAFHLETLDKQQVVAQNSIPLQSIERIDMQSNRGATRIAVILKNGDQQFPLGEEYIQNDPGQYKALVLMQQLWKDDPIPQAARN